LVRETFMDCDPAEVLQLPSELSLCGGCRDGDDSRLAGTGKGAAYIGERT